MVLWDKHPTAVTEIMVDAMVDDDNAAAILWSIIDIAEAMNHVCGVLCSKNQNYAQLENC
jgi:hypothetical protein